MGFLRGGLSAFLYTLIFICFLGMGIFLTVSSSLNFHAVQDEIGNLVYGLSESDSIISKSLGINEINFSGVSDDTLKKMQTHCANYTDYVFDYQGHTISVSCDALQTAGGAKQEILNETISGFVESIYYQQYECGFWNCFSERELPFFLLSQKAKDYWKQKFYFALGISILLLVLIFLLSENRSGVPIVIGIFLAVAVLPLLKISDLLGSVLGPPTSFLLDIFFSKANMVFWIFFLSGLVLVALGIAWKIMGLDFIKKLVNKNGEGSKSAQSEPTQEKKSQVKRKKK